jgi:hypothetical protein
LAANVLHDSRVHLIAPLPSLIHCSHVPPSLYARADQELVADELEGETDQDRRQGGEPWPLCRLSDRKISWNVCRGMATSASSMACMQVQPKRPHHLQLSTSLGNQELLQKVRLGFSRWLLNRREYWGFLSFPARQTRIRLKFIFTTEIALGRQGPPLRSISISDITSANRFLPAIEDLIRPLSNELAKFGGGSCFSTMAIASLSESRGTQLFLPIASSCWDAHIPSHRPMYAAQIRF